MKFGHTVYSYETVGSTQDTAKEKAISGESAGAVVCAAYQTGGRGRRGRGWFAPRGANVCMTVIGPPVALADAWQIALVAGVAVAEGIQRATGILPTLRFPNDILYGGAKIGGILVETFPHSEACHVTPLIGIGINVNIPENVFPDDLRVKATSLFRISGTEYSVDAVQIGVLERLGVQWDDFEQSRLEDAILPRWHALADPEARRVFVLGGESVSCRIIRITADGTLTLEAASGEAYELPASQVIFGED